MPANRKEKKDVSLHVMGYKEKDRCIAHCLEFDLVAEGATHKEARDNLVDLIFSYLHFGRERNIEQFAYHPAPKLYWDIFKQIQKKRISSRQSINPALLEVPKNRIKDFMEEARTNKVLTYA
jgi:hypothetical protein